MKALNYLFGNRIPDAICEKVEACGAFRKIDPMELQPGYCRDVFYADGRPVERNPDTLYPYYAAQYLKYTVPSSYLEVVPGYSKAAAVAAIRWLEKLLPNAACEKRHFDGEEFEKSVNGEDFLFCYPQTILTYGEAADRQQVVVVPFPDTRENNDDWENGTLPSYAEAVARMMLWCIRNAPSATMRQILPRKAMIVRITGNTPGDIQIRTVSADAKKEDALIKRLCRNVAAAKNMSVAPEEAGQVMQQQQWFEKKEQEREDAFHVDDPNYHELIGRYMSAASHRKSLEAEVKELSGEMNRIAFSLASKVSKNTRSGTVTKDGMTHSVFHTQKRSRSSNTVSAELVRQFYPEYAEYIHDNTIPRGRVTIEAV